MDGLAARYEALKEKVSERWAEFAELMKFVETETEYLTAPASTKFHLCKEGGLLEHSVNVAETLLKLKATLAPGGVCSRILHRRDMGIFRVRPL